MPWLASWLWPFLPAQPEVGNSLPDREHEPMILNLFRKKSAPEAVFAVYAAIVAQSRQARFYADWGVPDTVTGRFDMICLHLALVLRHLRGPDKAVGEFSQQLFDLFFKDMDRSLRELGAGDLSVPKKIQKMGNVFYGLLGKLTEALDAGDRDALETLLRRNVFDDQATPGIAPLADYLETQARQLAEQSPTSIVSGRIELGEAA